MTCHSCCAALEDKFDLARAQDDLAQYHAAGPDNTTRGLLDLIRRTGASRLTMLDVGGGVGVLHHELIGTVVAQTKLVEISPGYLKVARAEAERDGDAEAIQFVEGDFVQLAPQLPDADLVALDRVICCYPDGEALVNAAVSRAKRYVALSCPHYRWHVRAVIGVQNLRRRIAGSAFRTYVHDLAPLERILTLAGFARTGRRATFVWDMVLWERTATP